MPLSQLKTDSGIDHDFNFLSAIERARQRAEKDVVEARQLLSEKELRPRNEDEVFQKVWRGDELHHVPVQSQPYKRHGRPQEGPAAIDSFDKHVRRRLRYLDTEAITMPKGMARQRENKTAWNRRTQTINWQVEWLVYNASELDFTAQQPDQPLRVLHKSLEGTPLHSALATTLDWHRGQLDRQSREQQQDPIETDDEADPDSPKKRRKTHHGSSNNTTTTNKKTPPTPPTQNPSTTTWPSAPYTAQYPLTTTWSSTTTTAHLKTTLEEQLAATWRFYLVKPAVQTTTTTRISPSNPTDPPRNNRPASKTRTIVPLGSAETLTDVLRGRTVVEFPTLLAIPGGVPVPGGYVVGEFERRAARVVKENGVGGGGGEGEGEGGGYIPGSGGDKNNNRKRGFEGRGNNGNNKSWDRGKGTGANAGAMGGSGRGAGWKRARFGDAEKRHATDPEAVQGVPPFEAEEGEVNSDGDEVMDEALPLPLPRGGRIDGLLMDVDGDRSSVTVGREEKEDGEVLEGMEEGRPQGGGLVDYGSSDEDD
jgi:hypothetical protein